MGVIDSQWWSLRWPWMVVWLLTAVCVAVVAQYVVARWVAARRRRRVRDGRMFSGMCIYLHETRVEGVADILGIPKADVNVSHETSVSTGFGLFGRFTVGGRAERDTNTQTRREYWEPNTPMKTIRLIMDRLRARDMVVDADLATGQLFLTAALADELRGTEARAPPDRGQGDVRLGLRPVHRPQGRRGRRPARPLRHRRTPRAGEDHLRDVLGARGGVPRRPLLGGRGVPGHLPGPGTRLERQDGRTHPGPDLGLPVNFRCTAMS